MSHKIYIISLSDYERSSERAFQGITLMFPSGCFNIRNSRTRATAKNHRMFDGSVYTRLIADKNIINRVCCIYFYFGIIGTAIEFPFFLNNSINSAITRWRVRCKRLAFLCPNVTSLIFVLVLTFIILVK